MIRIAILADVHGNIHALNAALNDIKKHSIDYIYCLGDMIGIGPFSNEVLDALLETENLTMITGNHDEAVLALLNNEPYPKSRAKVITHHMWIAERLRIEYRKELEKLPRMINAKFYRQRLHLIHYPMHFASCVLPIEQDPFDQTGIPSVANFSVIDSLNDFSLVCFGHDHNYHNFLCSNKRFLNPGSLGCYNKPYARYALIEIDENGVYIKPKKIPYNLTSFVYELKKTSMPRKEIILRIYE